MLFLDWESMLVMSIYMKEKLIETKQFHNSFYIFADAKNKLFWSSDQDEIANQRSGIFKIWVQKASISPNLAFVLAEWRFVLDNQLMKPGFYLDVPLTGRRLELFCGDFRFECSFSGSPKDVISDIQPAMPA